MSVRLGDRSRKPRSQGILEATGQRWVASGCVTRAAEVQGEGAQEGGWFQLVSGDVTDWPWGSCGGGGQEKGWQLAHTQPLPRSPVAGRKWGKWDQGCLYGFFFVS